MAQQDIPTYPTLRSAAKSGNLPLLRTFLSSTLPSLASSVQKDFCSHLSTFPSPCTSTPCPECLLNLLTAAAEGDQPAIFAYIWDEHLYSANSAHSNDDSTHRSDSGHQIPWRCLKSAAYLGSVSLGEVFFDRDADCFNHLSPRPGRGEAVARWGQQFAIAIRSDRYEYIDFMLSHNGDIKAVFEKGYDLLRMVVNCAVEDDVTVRRVRFLGQRGVEVKRSGALRQVVEGGGRELAGCLLEVGADVDGVGRGREGKEGREGEVTNLMVAAREGYVDLVRLLLEWGADVVAVNGEGRDAVGLAKEKGHTGVVKILQEHQPKIMSPTPPL